MSSYTRHPFGKGKAPAPAAGEARRWPGLEPYSEADAERFFGRREEIVDLAQRVERRTLTVLFAQSGLGKTSVLRAGLFPTLRKGKLLPIYVRLDHAEGTTPLVEQVFDVLRDHLPTGVAREAGPPPTLWEWFHDLQEGLLSPRLAGIIPVLVFDQFEEIFTIGARNEEQLRRREEFLTQLADLAENRMPAALEKRLEDGEIDPDRYDFDAAQYRLLLALREDYLSYLDREKGRIPSLMQNRMPLDRLTGQRALEVVTGPAPDLVTPEVAEQIVRFVAGEAQAPLTAFNVEPPLLSLVCQRLDAARAGGKITSELLTGKREEILTGYYVECFAGLDPKVRFFIEDELVTESGHRESMAAERAEREIGSEAIQHLVDHRLLHTERRGNLQRLELTHDILAKLVVASRSERRGREQEAEQSAAQTERLRRIRKVLVGAVAVLVVVVALPLAGFALYAAKQARQNERRAEASAVEAATQAQLAMAAEQSAREAQRSAAREAGYFYAREALKAAARQSETLGEVPQPLLAWGFLTQGLTEARAEIEPARMALLERLLPAPQVTLNRRYHIPGGLSRWAHSPDGRWTAALRPDGSVILWSPEATQRSDFWLLTPAPPETGASSTWQRWTDDTLAGQNAQAVAFGQPEAGHLALLVATPDRTVRWVDLPASPPRPAAPAVTLPLSAGQPTTLLTFNEAGAALIGTSYGLVYRWTTTGPEAGLQAIGRSRFLDGDAPPAYRSDPRGRYVLVPSASDRDQTAARWQWQQLGAPYATAELEVAADEGARLVFEVNGDRFVVVRKQDNADDPWRVALHRGAVDGLETQIVPDRKQALAVWTATEGAELTLLGGLFIEPDLVFVLGSNGLGQAIEVRAGNDDAANRRARGEAAGAVSDRVVAENLPAVLGSISQAVFARDTRRFAVLEETGRLLLYAWERDGERWRLTGQVQEAPGGERFDQVAFDATQEHVLLRQRLPEGASSEGQPAFTHRLLVTEKQWVPLPELGSAAALAAGSFPAVTSPVLDLAVSSSTGLLLVTTPAGVEWWPEGGEGSRETRDWAPRGYQSSFLSPNGLEWRIFRRETGDRGATALLRWSAAWANTAGRELAEAERAATLAHPGSAWAYLPQGLGWLQGTETGAVVLTTDAVSRQPQELLRLPSDGLQRERVHSLATARDGRSAWVATDRGSVFRLLLDVPPDGRALWAREQSLRTVLVEASATGPRLGLVYDHAVEWRSEAALDLPGEMQPAPGTWLGQWGPWLAWRRPDNTVAVTASDLVTQLELPLGEAETLGAVEAAAGRWLVAGESGLQWRTAEGATPLALPEGLAGESFGAEAGWWGDGSGAWWRTTDGHLLIWSAAGQQMRHERGVVTVTAPATQDGLSWLQEPVSERTVTGAALRLRSWSPGAAEPQSEGELEFRADRLAVWPQGDLVALWGGELGSNLQFWSRQDGAFALVPESMPEDGWLQPLASGDWIVASPAGVERWYQRWARPELETLKALGGYELNRVSLAPVSFAAHQRQLVARAAAPLAVDEQEAEFWSTLAQARVRREAVELTLLSRSVDEAWAEMMAPWAGFLARYAEPSEPLARLMAPWLDAAQVPKVDEETDLDLWWAQLEPWGRLGSMRAIGPLQEAVNRPGLSVAQRQEIGRRLLEALEDRLVLYGSSAFSVGEGAGTGSPEMDAQFAADWRQLVTVMNGLYPWRGVMFWSPADDYPSLASVATLLPRPTGDNRWQGLAALELLEWEVRLGPEIGDYWNSLGVTYEQASRLEESRRAFELGATADQVSAYAVGNLANVLNREGRYAESLELLTALPEESTNDYSWRRLGETLDELGRHDEAEAAWRRSLAVTADSALSQRGLARSLVRQGRTAEALVIMDALVAKAPRQNLPELLEFYWQRAADDSLLQRGLELARRGVIEHGESVRLWQHLGKFRLELGDFAGAREAWQRGLELGARDGTFAAADQVWLKGWLEAEIAEALALAGDLELAVRQFDQAVRSNPKEHWAMWRRALAWQRLGQLSPAVASVRAARAVQPSDYAPDEARILWQRNEPGDREAAQAVLAAAMAQSGLTDEAARVEALWQARAGGELESMREHATALRAAMWPGRRAEWVAAAALGDWEAAAAQGRAYRHSWPTQEGTFSLSAAMEAWAVQAGVGTASRERALYFLTLAAVRGAHTPSLGTGPEWANHDLSSDERWEQVRAAGAEGRQRLAEPARWLALLELLATFPEDIVAASTAPRAVAWSQVVQFAAEQAWARGVEVDAARAASPAWARLRGHPAVRRWLEHPADGGLGLTELARRTAEQATRGGVDRSSLIGLPDQEQVWAFILQQWRQDPQAGQWDWTLPAPSHPAYFDWLEARLTLPPAPGAQAGPWVDLVVHRRGDGIRLRQAFLPPTFEIASALESQSPQVDGKHTREFLVEGEAGSRLRVELRSGAFDTFLRVLSPSGREWTNDDHGGETNSRVEVRLPESGRYRVVATSYVEGITGPFTLRYFYFPRVSTAGSYFEAGALTSLAEMENGRHRETYRVLGEAGTVAQIDLTSADFDPLLRLRGPTGQAWENDDFEGKTDHSRLSLTLPETGVYEVVATSYQAGSTGAYELQLEGVGWSELVRLEPAQRREERRSGDLGPTTGLHPRGGFVREYRVTLERGERVTVDLTSTGFDSYLFVYAPDGTLWENDDHEGSTARSQVAFTAPEDGDYRLAVTSFQAGETGTFEVVWTIWEASGRD